MFNRNRLLAVCFTLVVLSVVAFSTLGGTSPKSVSVALQRLPTPVPNRISLESKALSTTGRSIRSSKSNTNQTSVLPSSGEVAAPSHHPQHAKPMQDAPCPIAYPRLDADQIKAGRKPYIFGGPAENCKMCNEKDEQAMFCRKEAGAKTCSMDLQEALLGGLLNEMHRSDVLTFTPCDLWKHVSGRTVWVSGDGTVEDMFDALQCFLYEFVQQPAEWRKPMKVNGMQSNRLGIIKVECTEFIQDTKMCFIRCDVGQCQLNHVLPFLEVASRTNDLFVVNFGLHFDNNYIDRLSDFVGQLKLRQNKLPQVVWKDTVPTHYSNPLGDFMGGTAPFACAPLAGGSKNLWHSPEGHLETWDPALSSLLRGGTRNHASSQMLNAVSVPTISVYNYTVPLWQYHRDGQCTRYCFPSAPEIGVYGLFAALEKQAHAGQQSVISRHS
ncbi:hypothetical protein ABBQ38_004027 [Trebouxia sp. C0009 RCD-2024]